MEPLFSAEQLAEIKAYHLVHYVWAFADDALYFVVLAWVLQKGARRLYAAAESSSNWLSARLSWTKRVPGLRVLPRALSRTWGSQSWGAAVLFALFYLGLLKLFALPANVYLGYFHEHAYGLSNDTAAGFVKDELKALLLGVLPMTALAFGLFGLARRLKYWWLVLGVVGGVVMLGSAALDPYRARVFFEQESLPDGPLRSRLVQVLGKAQVDFQDIMVEKTSRSSKRIQAYFAGQGPTRTIVLNDVLLEKLGEDEVVAVLAHEAGHVHERRWPGRVASLLALLLTLFGMDWLMRRSAKRGWFGTQEASDVRNLPMLDLAFTVLMMLAAPVSGALSREREYQADQFAVRLLGDRDVVARMLVSAARNNKMDPDPPRWIVRARGWSHPPLGHRLEAVRR